MSKFKIGVAVVLGLVVLAVGAFVYINQDKFGLLLSGIELKTNADVQEAYENGFADGVKMEDYYIQQVDNYRGIIETNNLIISNITEQVTNLEVENISLNTQITNLTAQKESLNITISELTNVVALNEASIIQLNADKQNLQNQISDLEDELTNENANKALLEITISQLNSQVTNLQALVSQLQITNDLNNSTINSLNNQILNLNAQISDLHFQIQNNFGNVNALNSRITDLEQSVSYYEQYIANLESGTQAVVTFEFDGSVYSIQIVNKNTTVSITNPQSTDYVIFNFWMVDNEQIDLGDYLITTNVKIVANVTNKHLVKFTVEGSTVDEQFVVEDDFAILPDNPVKEGYEFDGWSLDGVNVINPETIEIIANTTFTAVFTQLHTITFMYDGEVVNSEEVRNGEYASNFNVDDTDYKIFNGWKFNDIIVDVEADKIFSAKTFVADITYKFDVEFMVDGDVINNQIITEGEFAFTIENPVKEGYQFEGWFINDTKVNVEEYMIIQNTIFTAIFIQEHTVTFEVDGATHDTQLVLNNNTISLPSEPTKRGYNFEGWSLDGVNVINPETIEITATTTFIAVFSVAEPMWHERSVSNVTYNTSNIESHSTPLNISSLNLQAGVDTILIVNITLRVNSYDSQGNFDWSGIDNGYIGELELGGTYSFDNYEGLNLSVNTNLLSLNTLELDINNGTFYHQYGHDELYISSFVITAVKEFY